MKFFCSIWIIVFITGLIIFVGNAYALSTPFAAAATEPLIALLFLIGGIPIAVNLYRKNRKFKD